MIYFRYLGEVLEVVNVLEGHRDVVAFFSDGDAPGPQGGDRRL
jgi:hypothetical protein